MEDVTREDGSRGGIFKIRVALKCDSVSQKLLSLIAQSLNMAGSWQDLVLRCLCGATHDAVFVHMNFKTLLQIIRCLIRHLITWKGSKERSTSGS